MLDYKNLRDKFIKIFRGFFIALIIGMPSYANTAGFDYPLGSPGGSGYSNDVGGLTYVEPYTYPEPCGYTYHPGEDWNDDDTGLDDGFDSNDAGDPVFAIADGIIEYANLRSNAWGNIILIRHDGTFGLPLGGTISTVWSQYAHLASIGINPRTNQQWTNTDTVYKGEQIGAVGDYPQGSGKAYHLHFEIRKESVAAYSFPCKQSKEQVKAVYIEPSLFIQNNRASSTAIFTFSPSIQSVNEMAGTAVFSLTRSDATAAQTVYVSTLQNRGSANVGDYIGKLDEPITFAIGDTSQTVTITVNNDAEIESDETFGLIIEDVPGGATLATASFTIVDNDVVGTVPPPNSPTITGFSADSVTISPGSSVNLTAVFADGTGVVDNGVGAIESGVTVSVSPATTTTYNLTVTSANGEVATQAVTISVDDSNTSDDVGSGNLTIKASFSELPSGADTFDPGKVEGVVGSFLIYTDTRNDNSIHFSFTPYSDRVQRAVFSSGATGQQWDISYSSDVIFDNDVITLSDAGFFGVGIAYLKLNGTLNIPSYCHPWEFWCIGFGS